MHWFGIYIRFTILRFHVVNLIILFIARLMVISAPMATINMRSRTTDYTAMACVAQKWLHLKKYWYYRFQSYCIRLQIKFRIRLSTLIYDKPFLSWVHIVCPECTHESWAVFRRTAELPVIMLVSRLLIHGIIFIWWLNNPSLSQRFDIRYPDDLALLETNT